MDKQIVAAQDTPEGAGARVRRLFPTKKFMDYDPFVLLDEFFVDPTAGFPEHPHRGFEAVTYMLEGTFWHRDILGNDSEVGAGGVQRFNAGRGLIHSEMPGGGTTVCHGLQLWINLPRRLKQSEPSYQQVLPEQIPEESITGGKIRTIIGPSSPVVLQTPVTYIDVKLEKNYSYHLPVISESNLFIYVYTGKVEVGGQSCGQGQACFMGFSGPDTVHAIQDSGFVFLAGRPHAEPIYHNGPYVD